MRLAALARQARLQQEAAAVTCLFLGMVLLLSLISYSLPLLGSQPQVQLPAANWCGHFGYYTARYLFSFFGLISFFPPLLFFQLAATVLTAQAAIDRLPFIVAGLTGVLLAASGLLASLDKLIFPPELVAPGGFLGSLLHRLLGNLLGGVGSALLLLLLLIFSLMAAVRFSPIAFSFWLWGQARNAGGKMAALEEPLREKLTAWKEEREQRKALPPPPAPEPAPVRNLPSLPAVIIQKLPFLREAGKAEAGSSPSSPDKKGKKTEEPPKKKKPVDWQNFELPPITLLEENSLEDVEIDRQHYEETSAILTAKLLDFSVQGEVVGISPGPVVTTYEFAPAAGIKISKIVNLADDLAMVLKVDRVRVVGSIPGKAAVGIEIPNPKRKTVFLRDILLANPYKNSRSYLTVALGFDSVGRPTVADLARMPHLLIAGATGAGKSVAINAFIASMLYKAPPDMVRLLMIDPKRIELSAYEGIPHLLHPVVVEPKMASRALLWAVREMERRYRLLEEAKVKSFTTYNKQTAEEKLPYIVIIVDELADLMMVASKDVETSIARLAQMARAAGMHIILATQRPSVDVLTGVIKANFPTRISFKVSSRVDSRTILDSSGAEHLLGAGDMLFLPPGAAKLKRIHGAYISEAETERIIAFLKEQGSADYDESVLQFAEEENGGNSGEEEHDQFYDQAVAVVKETRQASISMLQRRLRVGYNRAARMIEMMERDGIVGPSDGSRPREVLASME
ncbi:DNA segregation ATPase, FtsK/SpoIIIE family [Candidatus Electronema halotolerans]